MSKIFERNTRSYIFIFGDHTRNLVNISGKLFSSSRYEFWGAAIFQGFQGFQGNPWKFKLPCPATPTRRRAATVGSEITTRTIRSRPHRRLVSGARFSEFACPGKFQGFPWNSKDPWKSETGLPDFEKMRTGIQILFFRGGGHQHPQEFIERISGRHFATFRRWAA